MNHKNTYSTSLSRGLGALFIFAALQFLEESDYTLSVMALVIGLLNLSHLLWHKRWTTLILLGLNAGLSAIVFYKFLIMETVYLPWLWVIMLAYYVYRLWAIGKQTDADANPKPNTSDSDHPYAPTPTDS